MSTVIYLSNRQVQIVEGATGTRSISAKQYYTVTPPEGSIINGMVMDVGLFSTYMSSFWNQKNLPKKDVILVINSTKFVGRTIQVPIMKDKKILEFVEREYADMGKEEDMIYSFIHIENLEGKMQKIYAEGIEPDFIKDYLDIFSEMGIHLSAVYSGESSLITFTGQTAAQKDKTFVLLVADAMTLTTVLWVNGAFYYYNSARCFHDPGTPEYAGDIARSLSQLTQFMQANRIEHKLQSIQIAGVSSEDKNLYLQAITDLGIETPVYIFNFKTGGGSIVDPDLQNYLHAVSGLYIGDKTENFLPQYNAREKQQKNVGKADKTKTALLIGTTLLVMVVIFAALFFIHLDKKHTLNGLQAYNEDPSVQMEVMRNEVLADRNASLRELYNAIHDIDENIWSYPLGNDTVRDVFEECAKGYASVSYEAFDAEAGTITISAKAAQVDDINKFIKNLTERDTFCKVDYTGYAYDSSTNLWDIRVICTLSEAAGRDPANAPASLTEDNTEDTAAGSTDNAEDTVTGSPAGEE